MLNNYDESVEINRNPSRIYILDHSYTILIMGGSGSKKINMLLSLIKYQRLDVDKIYLYVKDPFDVKSNYQLFINKREKVGIKIFKNLKGFID